MKYRKKPVVIEAVQVLNSNEAKLEEFVGDKYWLGVDVNKNIYLEIETLEGTMRADHEDWIIRGIKGEFYPCKPDFFEETYEAVECSQPLSPALIDPETKKGDFE